MTMEEIQGWQAEITKRIKRNQEMSRPVSDTVELTAAVLEVAFQLAAFNERAANKGIRWKS